MLGLVMPAFVACSDAPTAPTRVEPVDPVGAPVNQAGPPFEGTVFISPNAITQSDATTLAASSTSAEASG